MGGGSAAPCCEVVGVDPRTVQRWRRAGGGEDRRRGPRSEPANKLSPAERAEVLAVVTSPEYCDLPASQIVPRLLDEENRYLASESTIHRILRQEKMAAHRERSRPASHRRPREHVATAANQVWSWDITYLRSPIRGVFFFLYLMMDVWSRKIVGWAVHEAESSEHAAMLFQQTCLREGTDPRGIVLHADNGGPMKGATLLATLQRLKVVTSFSRPRVSNDNPFSEALFRTMKYRPDFPDQPFASLEAARDWVAAFVRWYNTQHRHSAICFVTPAQRHYGVDVDILQHRAAIYEDARAQNPERWSGKIRSWKPADIVRLNPASAAATPTEEQVA